MPTLVIGVISYKLSENIIREKEADRTIRNLKDSSDLLFNYLGGRRNMAIRMSVNSDVIALLKSSTENGTDNLKLSFQIKKLMNDYRYTEGMQSIYLFDNTGKAYTNDASKTIDYQSITFNKWYSETLVKDIYMWGDARELNDVSTIPFYRLVRDMKTDDPIGLVLLNIREEYISQLYSKLEEPFGEIFVINQNGRVTSCKNKSLLGRGLETLIYNNDNINGTQGYFEQNSDGTRYFFSYYKDNILNWTYVYREKLDLVMSASEKIKMITILICLICLTVTFPFSVFLSIKVTKPVNKLVTLINHVQQGNLDVEANFKFKDEIGQIGSTFDSMTKRLKQNISELVEVQQKKREAEMQALLMQINPHFLYNTLTSIIWLTNNDKKKDVINMVSSLSSLFRIGISKGREIITVEEEIDHACSYLSIQKIRYKNEFNYEIHADCNVKRLFTLKLLLQPLVENSIYHGIKSMDSGGIIKINAFKNENTLIFEVIDNGTGITPEEIDKLNQFLSGESETSDFGIGIRNVNDRIRLKFGQEYGLGFSREYGYTIARITVPVMESDTFESE
jgi:Predicted signal transduction protein with a C-terminal ATPase domain